MRNETEKNSGQQIMKAIQKLILRRGKGESEKFFLQFKRVLAKGKTMVDERQVKRGRSIFQYHLTW